MCVSGRKITHLCAVLAEHDIVVIKALPLLLKWLYWSDISNITAVSRDVQGTEFLKAMTALLWPKWVGGRRWPNARQTPMASCGEGVDIAFQKGFCGTRSVGAVLTGALLRRVCIHQDCTMQATGRGGRNNFFHWLIKFKNKIFFPLSHPSFIYIVVILVQYYIYLQTNKQTNSEGRCSKSFYCPIKIVSASLV